MSTPPSPPTPPQLRDYPAVAEGIMGLRVNSAAEKTGAPLALFEGRRTEFSIYLQEDHLSSNIGRLVLATLDTVWCLLYQLRNR